MCCTPPPPTTTVPCHARTPCRRRSGVVRRAASDGSSSSSSSSNNAAPVATAARPASGQPAELVPDTEFAITQISYGSILTPIGLGLMVYGFGSYFTLLPGTDISSILLIYGFPISILGFALSYAQLPPVPCATTRAAYELRGSQMTDIQKQIREDTTRYRCAQEHRARGGWVCLCVWWWWGGGD